MLCHMQSAQVVYTLNRYIDQCHDGLCSLCAHKGSKQSPPNFHQTSAKPPPISLTRVSFFKTLEHVNKHLKGITRSDMN